MGEAAGSEARVLVVDDEPSITDLVGMALRYEGFTVATAASGREAISRAEQFRPDLIVLDVLLPDLTGPASWRDGGRPCPRRPASGTARAPWSRGRRPAARPTPAPGAARRGRDRRGPRAPPTAWAPPWSATGRRAAPRPRCTAPCRAHRRRRPWPGPTVCAR